MKIVKGVDPAVEGVRLKIVEGFKLKGLGFRV